MAIRLNLLAEAQALEDMRRRDPVKRVVFAGVVLALLTLCYSSSVQFKMMMTKSELSRLESELAALNPEYQSIQSNQTQLADITQREHALVRLATNRMLYGTLLNALQHTALPQVQLVRLKTDQSYVYTEEVKAKTNANRVTPGKPAAVTERILLTMEAKDTSANPGDSINTFKDSVASSPYLVSPTGTSNEVRLASLSPPQTAGGSKPFVLFTLECRYPEVTR